MPWKQTMRRGGPVKASSRVIKLKNGGTRRVSVKATTRKTSSNLNHK